MAAAAGLLPYDSSLEAVHDPAVATAFNVDPDSERRAAPAVPRCMLCAPGVFGSPCMLRLGSLGFGSSPGAWSDSSAIPHATLSTVGIRVPASSFRSLGAQRGEDDEEGGVELVQAVVKKGEQ